MQTKKYPFSRWIQMSAFPLTLGNEVLNVFPFQMVITGTRKIAQYLRALAALAGTLSSSPGTYLDHL